MGKNGKKNKGKKANMKKKKERKKERGVRISESETIEKTEKKRK